MHMGTIGIRELRQNASRVLADVAAGEEFIITDRGRPVARLTAVVASPLQALIDAGLAREARGDINSLAAPEDGPSLSEALEDMRNTERY